jgi:hypothetical protein
MFLKNVINETRTSQVKVEANARESPAHDASIEGFRRITNAIHPIRAPVAI